MDTLESNESTVQDTMITSCKCQIALIGCHLGETAAVHLEMPQSYGIFVQLLIGVAVSGVKWPTDAII